MKKRVRVLVDGRVSVVLSGKGYCRSCGEVIAYSGAGKMWFHVLRLKGQKYYDHEARLRGRRSQEQTEMTEEVAV